MPLAKEIEAPVKSVLQLLGNVLVLLILATRNPWHKKVVVRGEEQDGAGSCCSSAVVQFRQCYFLPCTSRAKTNGPWVTNTS
ncbi:hypothetical protein QQP08_012014 [Theobroma cacao]|nr:hypothetical protein QQP08_012014 [Theobroma cacao]